MTLSLLSGGVAGKRLDTAAQRPNEPSAAQQRMDAMFEVMRGTLDYLRLEPEERARREAGELLEQERQSKAQLEAQLTELRQSLEATVAQRAQLQAAIEERQKAVSQLEADLQTRQEEALRLSADWATRDAAYQAELLALKNRAPTMAPAPPPQIITQAPVRPEKINFEHIRDLNGLLSRVILRADGYEDVAIDVVRDGGNRMQTLKIGGNK